MTIPEDTQQIYEELALQCQQRQQNLQRDQFLLLAADSAHTLGRTAHAKRLHRQLLQLSPSTMLRPFASFAEALDSCDVRAYVDDLRQQYPPETAAQMLEAGSSSSHPTDLFSDTVESDLVLPMSESNPFGSDSVTAPAQVSPRRHAQLSLKNAPAELPAAEEKKRSYTAPSLQMSPPPVPAAADVPVPSAEPTVSHAAPAAPARPRRRSPYEDPDYGPKIPAAPKTKEDDEGIWFIHVLAGLLGLAGIAALVYVLVRPFLAG